ncbi:hypothetical protein HLB44_36510 [Aquincola sp. S2]|uniref:Uncharacterized protein n=1 Tax=Pseudaquabacterium terrae TaxID=2732868 RepID=A0ABX2EUN9_9BURK|nr:hypothetical protein [Aquabacterium terrae]NRF72467.1 hypothetical protein [Aquabacterium terrae]
MHSAAIASATTEGAEDRLRMSALATKAESRPASGCTVDASPGHVEEPNREPRSFKVLRSKVKKTRTHGMVLASGA